MTWTSPPALPVADGEHVHIWAIDLDREKLDRYILADVLSTDECERAVRYRFEKDRAHFIAARGSLRVILALYAQCKPEDLAFFNGEHGKPALAARWNETGVMFNVSHSVGLALVAVCRSRDVGVDVEHQGRDVKNMLQLARRFFSEREYEQISALPEAQQRAVFLRCWTRKEAFVKALGTGLTFSLKDFDVSLGDDARLERIKGGDPGMWTLQSIDPGEGYVGAVSVNAQDIETICWKI